MDDKLRVSAWVKNYTDEEYKNTEMAVFNQQF